MVKADMQLLDILYLVLLHGRCVLNNAYSPCSHEEADTLHASDAIRKD